MIVPQANDIDKILDLPLAIADGANTKQRIIKRYDFDGRQADYYLEVGEALELLKREGGMYYLTEDGKKYLRMDPQQQKLMVVRKMVAMPVVSSLLGELIASEGNVLSRNEIAIFIKEHTHIRGSTVARRVECIFKWLEWMADETEVFRVQRDTVGLRISEKLSS
jgi:hypothetical protein